jgi:hypothetical protein
MKKKKRRLLRLEGLETRNLPSPMHGLEAQSLLSFPSPTLTSDLTSTANAEPVERQDATDALKANRESDAEKEHQNAEDTSAVQAIPDSSDAEHGNHHSDTLTETENHSPSDGNPDATQNAGDQGMTGVTPVPPSVNAEVNNDVTQAIADSSEADHGNHLGDNQAETENHSSSDGNPHATQNSSDQKDESAATTSVRPVQPDNNTSPQASSNQSGANQASSDGSTKDAVDHSKGGKNSGNDVDPAKQPAVSVNQHGNTGGNQKVSGDSDYSNSRSGLGSDGRSSTGSGDQVSSGNPGQSAGKTGDSDEGGITLVSDGGIHSQANPGHKDVSSPVSSAGSDLLAGHAVHNTSITSVGSSSTSGILLDAAPLAASLALQSLEAGTDLPDLPRFADTAVQVLHTGVEFLATPIGMGGMTALETLPVGACDLLLGFLPVDQDSLDQAMQGFLSRLDDLGEQLTGSEAGTWLYPVVLTVLVTAHVVSRRRRRSSKQQIWTVDRGSWMGNWFPSLSTLQR